MTIYTPDDIDEMIDEAEELLAENIALRARIGVLQTEIAELRQAMVGGMAMLDNPAALQVLVETLLGDGDTP